MFHFPFFAAFSSLLPKLNNCLLRMQNVFWSHQNATKHWQNQRFNIIILHHYQKTQFAYCYGQNDVVSRFLAFWKKIRIIERHLESFWKVNPFAWSLEQWVNVTTILSSLLKKFWEEVKETCSFRSSRKRQTFHSCSETTKDGPSQYQVLATLIGTEKRRKRETFFYFLLDGR